MKPCKTLAEIRQLEEEMTRYQAESTMLQKPWLRIGSAFVAALTVSGAVDPMDAKIDSVDAFRFAALFQQNGGKLTAQQLQRGYLDGAGKGVAVFTANRIENAQNLARAVAADPGRYAYAINTCLPLLEQMTPQMRSIYLAYGGLLPEKPLPAVYVVFGAGNSGGTASAEAQVLGLEVLCGPGTTPKQFVATMRSMFAHETVHSWQPEPSRESTKDLLLFAALREGVPDYLAALVTGEIPDSGRNAWARDREAWLWAEFNRDRARVPNPEVPEANTVLRRWFGNYGSAPEGWPSEAGYWVGMRIAERYVAQAKDKRAAIRDLIELKDPAAILAASGYTGKPAQ